MTHEQKAQELASQCANALARDLINGKLITEETILLELNLAKLVEDAAMLDWVEQQEFVNINYGRNCRTAIRNAMKEEEK